MPLPVRWLILIWDFGKNPQILGHCLVLNKASVHWLRLQIHMEWFPHLLHTYKRWLTTIICCGWGYGSIIVPLPKHWLILIWEERRSNPWSLLGAKWSHCAKIQVEWFQHLLNTWERWLTTFICCGWGYRPIIMPLPVRWLIQIWEEASNPWSLLGAEWGNCALVEAPNPRGMVPTPTPYIWKVIDNNHMLWMGIWIHHHAVTYMLVNPDLGSQLKSLVTAWRWMKALCSG